MRQHRCENVVDHFEIKFSYEIGIVPRCSKTYRWIVSSCFDNHRGHSILQMLNRPLGDSIFMGFLIALSFTAIVLRVLQSRAEFDTLVWSNDLRDTDFSGSGNSSHDALDSLIAWCYK